MSGLVTYSSKVFVRTIKKEFLLLLEKSKNEELESSKNYTFNTQFRIKGGDRFPRDHGCRNLLFMWFFYINVTFNILIDESEGCTRFFCITNKKFLESCFLVLLNILDSEIEKRLKLIKAGKLVSIQGRGAISVCKFLLLINGWMDEIISGIVLHSKGSQRVKLIILQEW